MKTMLYHKINGVLLLALGLALITLGVLTLCESCNSPQPQTTEVVVLWDVTEPHQPIPEAGDILPLYKLDTDPSRGAIFRFSVTSDVQLNEQRVFVLSASAQNALANPFDREREVQEFINNVTAFLNSLSMDTVGREHSALYVPIAITANALSLSSSDRKVLLLFTDLRENTSRISFYDKRTLVLLQTDSAKVAALLQEQEPLNELSGIEAYVLYQPRDIADDETFAVVSRFYRGFLTNKGATVTIAANLNP